MKKNFVLLIAIFIIAVLAGIILLLVPSNQAIAPTTNTNATTTPVVADNTPAGIADLIEVEAPLINAKVGSPLTIKGKARGTWYFEASFPIELKDAAGKTIALEPAQAQGEWMTTDFVPFSLTLTFPAQPTASKGTLILHKDNPSGEPARDQSVSIPVIF